MLKIAWVIFDPSMVFNKVLFTKRFSAATWIEILDIFKRLKAQ